MRILTLSICFLLLGMPLLAQQSRTELEKERQETERELEDVNRQFNEIRKNKKESLGQLSLIQRKIRLRSREMDNINQQIRAVDDSMFFINREIYRLRADLDTLKEDYAKSLIYAYKNRSSYDFLNFLFSATSFNDAIRRVQYLKSYRSNQEQQAQNILQTEVLIQNKAKDFAATKTQKGEVLNNESRAREKLEEERKEKDAVVADLKTREKGLSSQIADKRRQLSHLQLAINTAIRRAIAESKKNAAREKPVPAAPAPGPAAPTAPAPTATEPTHSTIEFNTAEDIKLSANFASNKGRLPWPVDRGYVVAHYGRNNVEGTPIVYNENGITIGASIGTQVKAVFDGNVSSVTDVSGSTAVIVQHGKYFTVYSNLDGTNLSKGDKVHLGQVLGTVAAAESGAGQIDFYIMDELQPENPEFWLRAR